MNVSHLSKIINAEIIKTADLSIVGFTTDSRSAKPADCFIAINGQNFDGHRFVSSAFAKGAVCAIVENHIDSAALDGKAVLKVKSTIEALANLASHYRRNSSYKLIAITGSAGKTTTKNLLHTVLSKKFKCHKSPASFNNNIGLPLTILTAEADTEILIAEIGTNAPGEIAQLAKIAAPDIALITNTYPAHLAGLGSIENIIKEKTSIIAGLKPAGTLIINSSCQPLINYCRNQQIPFTAFGSAADCKIADKSTQNQTTHSRFVIEDTPIRINLPGKANIENTLACWAVCKQLGIKIDEFAQLIKNASSVPGRMQVLNINGTTVIDDCYNANPASMQNALDFLAQSAKQTGQRAVFICGSMAELGSQSEKLHAQLGKTIAEANVDLLIAAGRYAQTITKSAQHSPSENLSAIALENTEILCDNLHRFLKSDDIILVKASRSEKFETVIERLRKIFKV